MKVMKQTGRGSVTPRLVISGLVLGGSLLLSAMAFYYYHASAPLIPLLVGLIGVVPMGIIIDELRRLLKLKKPQQPHQPPNRS
jgi:CHASE2 domain-containing sensor protein